MESSNFENIKSAVKERSFKNEKIDALKATLSCSYGYLSADQVAQLVEEFSFDDDKVKAVEICAPRMYSTTCQQAASILRVIKFSKSKITALEAIASHITDNNLAALDSVLDFARERNRAKEILMNRSHSGPQPGLPPQPGVYPGVRPPAGSFPGMTPHAGGYPAPAPYPGPSPYPGQSPHGSGTYGGMCPPGQPPYGQPGPGAVPRYPPGPPHAGFPPDHGGSLGAMEGMMNATAGAADAMMKGMKDTMFGGHGPAPRQAPQYPPPGGHYPPPGGYPHGNPGYLYQPK